MTFLKTSCARFALIYVTAFSFASIAQAETIEIAVQSALQEHPSVESAQAVIEAAHQQKREEVSGYFPEVSMNGTGGRMYGDNSTSRGLSVDRGAGYSYLWEGQVTARQMLFDGFETSNRVRSAKAKEVSADKSLIDVRETLSLRAVQAYLDVMRAKAGLALLREHEKKVDDYLGRIKASVDEGSSDEAQHQQARDVKVILEGFINDYEAQVRTAEADYAEVTGGAPQGEMAAPHPQIDLIPSALQEALTYAEQNHPSLQAAIHQSEASGYDIDSEQAQLYPDVNGELSYLKSDKADIIGGEVVDGRAVVRMNWNIETGGAQLARIKRKKYEHHEAVANLEELKRQVARGVRLAYSEIQAAQEQLENSRQRIDLNTKLFETYKVQFEGARITLLQMMQADNQLFNTKLEKMNADYRVLAAQYATLASMGRLQGSMNLAEASTGPAAHEQK
jgi:outer membrane protein, adhesin transport system